MFCLYVCGCGRCVCFTLYAHLFAGKESESVGWSDGLQCAGWRSGLQSDTTDNPRIGMLAGTANFHAPERYSGRLL